MSSNLSDTATRQSRAIESARSVASRYGIERLEPRILHDSNHTIVHLAPVPLVAKVNTSSERSDLRRELRIADYLTARGAPVVPPTSLLPPGPHCEAGLELTFWEYCPHDATEPDPETLGCSLHALHQALEDFPDPLPAWDEFDALETVLFEPSALQALPREDRDYLRTTYHALRDEVAGVQYHSRPLHSEPHSGNLLLSPHGPRWIDFESACSGPAEWDLTVLPDDVVRRHFADVDYDLLRILKRMRSLVVATWCWLDPDRDPLLREAGTFHLRLLRSQA